MNNSASKILFLLLLLFASGCNTTKSINPVQTQTSSWTMDGVTYKAYQTSYDASDKTLWADDNNGNFFYINFSFIRKPTIAGEYEIIDYIGFSNATQCQFMYQNNFTAKIYVTRNVKNKKLSLSFTKNGKLKVVFNSVPIYNYNNESTSLVSGVLIED